MKNKFLTLLIFFLAFPPNLFACEELSQAEKDSRVKTCQALFDDVSDRIGRAEVLLKNISHNSQVDPDIVELTAFASKNFRNVQECHSFLLLDTIALRSSESRSQLRAIDLFQVLKETEMPGNFVTRTDSNVIKIVANRYFDTR